MHNHLFLLIFCSMMENVNMMWHLEVVVQVGKHLRIVQIFAPSYLKKVEVARCQGML